MREARQRALELLEALDVAHRARAQPSQLSGGEQQRVSIARALANHPPVILADEPTAPLDSERALAVMRILNQMALQYQTAIIVVTHDEKIIPTFKRIYHIRDGKTYEEAGQGLAVASAVGRESAVKLRGPGFPLCVLPLQRPAPVASKPASERSSLLSPADVGLAARAPRGLGGAGRRPSMSRWASASSGWRHSMRGPAWRITTRTASRCCGP